MPFSSLNFAICVGLDTTDMTDFLILFLGLFVLKFNYYFFVVVINVIIIIMFCKLIEVFHNQY